jgi:two-component system, OmpR family, sensor histidine kinase KdpD
MRKKIIRFFAAFLGPIALVGLTTLALDPIFAFLNVQNIALLFLLPVMLSAALWGMVPGLLAGFITFLAFNYFFIKPYNTLLVHQSQDLITLAIFLVVSIVVSQLLGRARKAALAARAKEWEATRMYELISALAGANNQQSVVKTLAGKLVEIFHLDYARVEVYDSTTKRVTSGQSPESDSPRRLPDRTVKMKTYRDEEGAIQIWNTRNELTDAENRLLEAFAAQSALAIERIRLTENQNKVRVLEEGDLLKTSLLNSVSHELRTPLAAIKASISSLRSGTIKWGHAARNDLLAMIEEETDKLNQLVGNLLDMSRIESGSLKPNLRLNSLTEIARGVAQKMSSQTQNHIMKFDFPVEIPPVLSDYVLLEQVFTNLISNSIKYAPEQTPIVLTARVEGDNAVVRVRNQSPHVDKSDLEYIFEKFYRASKTDKVLGTGLGLSICKGIVEAHGGRIWAANSVDGFTFIFTLPLAAEK